MHSTHGIQTALGIETANVYATKGTAKKDTLALIIEQCHRHQSRLPDMTFAVDWALKTII